VVLELLGQGPFPLASQQNKDQSINPAKDWFIHVHLALVFSISIELFLGS